MLVHPGALALYGILWILITETQTYCSTSRIRIQKRAVDAAKIKSVLLSQKNNDPIEAAVHATPFQKEEGKNPCSLIDPHGRQTNGWKFGSPGSPGKQDIFGQGEDTPENKEKKNLAALTETEEIVKKIGVGGTYMKVAGEIAEASFKLSNGDALKQDVKITSNLVSIKFFDSFRVDPRNPIITSSTMKKTIEE